MSQLQSTLRAYDIDAPLESAKTPPSAWYTDPRIAELERETVFARSWQLVARLDQLTDPGRYVTASIAGEPIAVVRGRDGVLRAFYNVCRHHAAEVLTQPEGSSHNLRCPYHGWTYSLEGELKGCPEFKEVRDFDPAQNGLVPVRLETWEKFVFVCLAADTPPLREHLGAVAQRVAPLKLGALQFFERRVYDISCNWKVYVDNYLDGGYHVPHIHKGLNSVIDYTRYTIENLGRACIQATPLDSAAADKETAAVRGGAMGYYVWLHPNLMLNWYEGYLDTNLVLPLGVDRCRVIFDFYFADAGGGREELNRRSVAVAERVQQEDIDICESVQRGLRSRAYDVGRLSVRREGGEHLFHRLLAADLRQNG
jgi:choline monooxygenase